MADLNGGQFKISNYINVGMITNRGENIMMNPHETNQCYSAENHE